MQKYFLLSILLISAVLNLSAETITQKIESYDQAQAHQNFIKFTGKSTKFGLVTTEFDGYAKDFTIQYAKKESKLENIQVDVIASAIDTDSDARNDKMYQLCLEIEKYKMITVTTNTPIDLTQAQQVIAANLKVRDKTTQIELQIEIKQIDGKTLLIGKSQFLLTALSIPDPSIAIARVHDQFQLSFQAELKP